MLAGEIYKTDNWGDVEIIEYVDYKNVKIRFLDSGNISVKRSREIKHGNIRDQEAMDSGVKAFSSHSKGQGALSVGEIYESNFFGSVKVIDYKGSREVYIEFLDTGNQYKVQKDALTKGLVKDSVKEREDSANLALKRKEEKDEAKRVKLEEERIAKEKRTFDQLSRREQTKIAVDKRREEKLQKKLKRQQEVMSRVYTSDEYGDYRAVVALGPVTYEVVFKNTGGMSVYSEQAILSGKVKDTLRYTEEELEQQKKQYAARNYQENREKRLQQAKDYQKNNPEKSRLRNRNRRARRVGAEGSYTQADLDLILEEQGCKCAGCSCDLDDSKHMDHYTPLALGGTNYPENIQWLCQFCNNSKSAKDPLKWLAEIVTPEYQARRAAALAY